MKIRIFFGETLCYKVRNADRFHNMRFQSQQIVISLSNSYIGREREREVKVDKISILKSHTKNLAQIEQAIKKVQHSLQVKLNFRVDLSQFKLCKLYNSCLGFSMSLDSTLRLGCNLLLHLLPKLVLKEKKAFCFKYLLILP